MVLLPQVTGRGHHIGDIERLSSFYTGKLYSLQDVISLVCIHSYSFSPFISTKENLLYLICISNLTLPDVFALLVLLFTEYFLLATGSDAECYSFLSLQACGVLRAVEPLNSFLASLCKFTIYIPNEAEKRRYAY